jgi:hypothetical protein
MSLPKTSSAPRQYRLGIGSGDYPEAVIGEIARLDKVTVDEAARRYEEAKAQHARRGAAQITRGLRQRGALESMRWAILCRCEAVYSAAPKGADLVEVTDALLYELASAYRIAARARWTPEREWVRLNGIEHLYQAGLIVRGMAGMRITDAGRAYVAEKIL